jgi:hypothetical protein
LLFYGFDLIWVSPRIEAQQKANEEAKGLIANEDEVIAEVIAIDESTNRVLAMIAVLQAFEARNFGRTYLLHGLSHLPVGTSVSSVDIDGGSVEIRGQASTPGLVADAAAHVASIEGVTTPKLESYVRTGAGTYDFLLRAQIGGVATPDVAE